MKNLFISIKITLTFCVVLFVGYVLVLWGVAFIATPNHGQAEIVTLGGKVVGASNVGQEFKSDYYFWARPSAVDYDGSGSGGSNKSNGNPDYLKEVSSRIDTFVAHHPYLSREQVPSEMITASGSGLDPHISVESAKIQSERVAKARGVSVDEIVQVIDVVTDKPLVGGAVVNVLKLNVELDQTYGVIDRD